MDSSKMEDQSKQQKRSRLLCPGFVEGFTLAFAHQRGFFRFSRAWVCIGSLKHMLFKAIISVHFRFGWKRNTGHQMFSPSVVC